MSNDNKKAVTPLMCEISSTYYDPVEIKHINPGQEITITDSILFMTEKNPFTGYYGLPRWDGSEIIKHTGYDYVADPGITEVKAVHDGYIRAIKFGQLECVLRNYFLKTDRKKLSFKKDDIENNNTNIENQIQNKIEEIKKNSNDKEKVKTLNEEIDKLKKAKIEGITCCYYQEGNKLQKCPNLGGCYGLQVFLQDSCTKKIAFYAHLSELNTDVFKEEIVSKATFNNADPNVLEFNPIHEDREESGIHVDGGKTIIGKSGITGNASKEYYTKEGFKPHLHFECRYGNNYYNGRKTKRCSPNKIVKTEFKIKNKSDESKPLIERIEEDNIIEYSIRKQIADVWKIDAKKGRGVWKATRDNYIKEHQEDIKKKWTETYKNDEYPSPEDSRWKEICEAVWQEGKLGEYEKYENAKYDDRVKEREKLINKKIEEKFKKIEKKLKNELKNDSNIRNYIDNVGWPKKKEEFRKKGRKFSEYNNEEIDKFYDDLINNRDNEYLKDVRCKKNEYQERFKAEIENEIRKEDWERVKKEECALERFREDHKLVVSNIKEAKSKSQEVR